MKTKVFSTALVSRTVNRFLATVALLFVSVSVLAQAPLKIAVLDMGAALFNTEIAKTLDQKLKEETSDDQTKMRSLATEATGLQEQMQKDAATMSDEEKRKTAEKIEEIGVQYQFLGQKLEKLVKERREQFQQSSANALYQAITEVVQDGAYDIVLRAEAALHFSPSYDITASVTEKINQQQNP